MPSQRRLKTASDVRRFLAHLIGRVDKDQVEPMKAGRMGYLANLLLSALRADDLEKRIEALEQRLNGRQTVNGKIQPET